LKLLYLPRALADLRSIDEHIARDNQKVAFSAAPLAIDVS
jgi:hypothetical protein